MQGNKTHQQQRSIIQKDENTANGGADFDARADLDRDAAAREAFRKGEESIHARAGDVSMNDDPSIVRGVIPGRDASR
ncbi:MULTISPECIES: hypothetical protein [unclassified Rhizobium]|uniref:hypothetical protein n=1 Tax=unclassified Rhizobium TaxID=2613769 RepID=UPI003D2DE8A2